MKKYEFTGETKAVNSLGNINVRRIKAKKLFQSPMLMKANDLGGWIQKVENLSHKGNAWIAENARVYDDAQVYDNAGVCGNAKIYENAMIYGNAEICDNVWAYGNAQIYGDARISDNAEVCDYVKVYDHAEIFGSAEICGNAKIYGNAEVYDNVVICGNARVYGNAKIHGNAEICDNAVIFSENHVFVAGPIGSQNDFVTFYRDKDRQITVKCGCFLGKMDEFIKKIQLAYGDSKYALAYQAVILAAKFQIDLTEESAEKNQERGNAE